MNNLRRINNEEIIFNIYLIDRDLFFNANSSTINGTSDLSDKSKEMRDEILKSVLEQVVNNSKDINSLSELYYRNIEGENFSGIVYTKETAPQWANYIEQFLTASSKDSNYFPKIRNSSTSYLILYTIDDQTYATTGGYASSYIEQYIIKKFGLLLLSKIINEGDAVIKRVNEINFTGNKYSVNSANRVITGFSTEKEYSKIFNEVLADLDHNSLDIFGINVELDQKISVISSDYFSLRIKLNLEELQKILETINIIMARKSNFSLGNFIPIKERRISKNEMDKKLFTFIADHNDKQSIDFELTGPDQIEYLKASEYIISDGDRILYRKSTRPTFKDVIKLYEEDKDIRSNYSITSIKNILKNWKIDAIDYDGKPFYFNRSLFDSMNGSLKVDIRSSLDKEMVQEEVFLTEGQWFLIDQKYLDLVEREFKLFFNESIMWANNMNFFQNTGYGNTLYIASQVDSLSKSNDVFNEKNALSSKDSYLRYNLKETFDFQNLSENEFNNILSSTINEYVNTISADKVLLNNIEVADFIYFDDDNLYLIHNKRHFTGTMVRDITNQIFASASVVRNLNTKDIDLYYTRLINNDHSNTTLKNMGIEKFEKLFSKKIIFVCCIVDDFQVESNVNYAKILLNDQYKRLRNMFGFEYYFMSIKGFYNKHLHNLIRE